MVALVGVRCLVPQARLHYALQDQARMVLSAARPANAPVDQAH